MPFSSSARRSSSFAGATGFSPHPDTIPATRRTSARGPRPVVRISGSYHFREALERRGASVAKPKDRLRAARLAIRDQRPEGDDLDGGGEPDGLPDARRHVVLEVLRALAVRLDAHLDAVVVEIDRVVAEEAGREDRLLHLAHVD